MKNQELGLIELPYKNEKTPSGTEPIARCELGEFNEIVVCEWPCRNLFVVWNHNMRMGGFYWGHYFSTRSEALEHFCQKVNSFYEELLPSEEEEDVLMDVLIAEAEKDENLLSNLGEEDRLEQIENRCHDEHESSYWNSLFKI